MAKKEGEKAQLIYNQLDVFFPGEYFKKSGHNGIWFCARLVPNAVQRTCIHTTRNLDFLS
jgi:hypothetical protein